MDLTCGGPACRWTPLRAVPLASTPTPPRLLQNADLAGQRDDMAGLLGGYQSSIRELQARPGDRVHACPQQRTSCPSNRHCTAACVPTCPAACQQARSVTVEAAAGHMCTHVAHPVPPPSPLPAQDKHSKLVVRMQGEAAALKAEVGRASGQGWFCKAAAGEACQLRGSAPIATSCDLMPTRLRHAALVCSE